MIDLVQRRLHAASPDRLWFTDLTMIRTNQGWLYAAVVLDAFNRRGHQLRHRRTDETPKTALPHSTEAIRGRRPPRAASSTPTAATSSPPTTGWPHPQGRAGRLDRRTKERPGQRRDGVVVRLVEERGPLSRPTDQDQAEARSRLFDYVWDYNHHRLHSALGYRSPMAYATMKT